MFFMLRVSSIYLNKHTYNEIVYLMYNELVIVTLEII